MANEQNLTEKGRFNSENAREAGRKGGLATAAVRQRKKTMRGAMQLMLAAPVSAATDRKQLKKMGVPVDDMTHDDLVALAMVRRAIDGDVPAFRAISQILGEDTRAPAFDSESDGLFDAIAKALGGKA